MDPQNATHPLLQRTDTVKSQRRTSFSPMKAIRSLSFSSQRSTASDTDLTASLNNRRRTLRKTRAPEQLKGGDLIREASKSSAEEAVDIASVSTRPTTPSGAGSRGTSISGDFVTVVKSGALQPESSILKAKKEYLVLTSKALLKFKSQVVAAEHFPQLALPDDDITCLTPIESRVSHGDFGDSVETFVPLEKVISVFNDEGTRPSFGLELWWRNSGAISAFACLQLDFRLPCERDDWLKQIQHAVKLRGKSLPDDRVPLDVEMVLRAMPEARDKSKKDAQLDIYPFVPRRPYTRLRATSGEVKKIWRDSSSFYLTFTKNCLLLAQFSKPPTGQKVNPSLVQFGLVTLARVNTNANDERFDLVFRLPLDQPKKLELSSRYHRTILSKLFKMDTYLKPAWPLWTRREVYLLDGEAQQILLPNGEDYGGFRTTLEAFLEAYRCPPVNWAANWSNVRYSPEFRLYPPQDQSQYTAHQLLAVFRALRFNEYFKSLSFANVDFSSLTGVFDNIARLESTVWLSRTGKRSLTRGEFELVESSSVLFQEIVSLLLGSESIRHVDFSYVLSKLQPPSELSSVGSIPSQTGKSCEILPPIILLWKSMQTRCSSINLSGNALDETNCAELGHVFQNRPDFLRTFAVSRCQLDDNSLISLWDGLHEQRSSIEHLDMSDNSGRVDAGRATYTLGDAYKLKRLHLANALKGYVDGPLFRPWSSESNFEPWKLEELDLSGWKINFDTLCGIMKYLEMDESSGLRRLVLSNCGLSGEGATGILCRIGAGRDVHLDLSGNPLEVGSTDWIDLLHGNEAPTRLHLDMVQFQLETNFNQLLIALTHNQTIEFLSMVGTGPPDRASSKTSELLSGLFATNKTLKFLDLSGYSGKLEDAHFGWELSGALAGLKQNTSLRQLRIRNHDLGTAKDVTEVCRVLAANEGLLMFDCQNNNFDHHQFAQLVHALQFNRQVISFPMSNADREFAIQKEKKQYRNDRGRPVSKIPYSKKAKAANERLDGLMTWLESHWDSEAKKVQEILDRNRVKIAEQGIELEGEYLDAWEDNHLHSLPGIASTNRDKGKTKLLSRSSVRSLIDLTHASPSSSSENLLGGLRMSRRRTISSSLPTYTIKEEPSIPDFNQSLSFDTSPAESTADITEARWKTPSSRTHILGEQN